MFVNNPRIVTDGIKGCWDPLMPDTATSATLLYEQVGSGVDGTMYNGGCLDFDGTNDYVLFGSYTPGNGSWTVSMWVNADAFSNYTLLSNTSGSPVASAFYIETGGKISYANWDGWPGWQYHFGDTTLSTGTWYLCTWVNYAGSLSTNATMKMFVNGVADSSEFGSVYTTNGGPVDAIGRQTGSYFNGKIADVRFYNVALSDANVKELYDDSKVIIPNGVSQTNLKRWWPMIDGAGTIAYDGSGYGKNGILTNMDPATDWTREGGAPALITGFNRPMTFGGRYITGTATQTSYNITGVGTAWTPAMVGRDFVFSTSGSSGTILEVTSATALRVDVSKTVTPAESYVIGGTDYVAIGTTNPMQFIWSDNFSLSAWIFCDSVSGFKHIIGKTYGNYRFAQDGGTISLRLDTNIVLCAGSCLTAKKWHHVVATYETNSPSAGGTAKVYCDGSLLSTCASSSLDWTSTGGTFQIGNSPGESYYFGGIINECIAYNKTLSLAEVQALANTDANGGPLPPNPMSLADSGNVVGYWRNDGDVTWTDRSSNSNYGTVAGSPSALLFKQGYNGSASTTTGRDNQGFQLRVKNVGAIGFNGSSDYVSLTSRNYNLSTACSFLFWSKRLSSATNDYVLGNTGHSSYDKINFEGARLYLESNTNTDSAYTDAVCATDNEWHHYAVIVDAGTVSVYEDGVSLGMGAATVTDTYMTINEMGRAGTNVWFFGSIATMNTYDRALTYAEIQQNYNSFKNRFGK